MNDILIDGSSYQCEQLCNENQLCIGYMTNVEKSGCGIILADVNLNIAGINKYETQTYHCWKRLSHYGKNLI